jgi:hypothetical protein
MHGEQPLLAALDANLGKLERAANFPRSPPLLLTLPLSSGRLSRRRFGLVSHYHANPAACCPVVAPEGDSLGEFLEMSLNLHDISLQVQLVG